MADGAIQQDSLQQEDVLAGLSDAERAFALELAEAKRARSEPPTLSLTREDDRLVIGYGGADIGASVLRLHSVTGLRHHAAVTFLLQQLIKLYDADTSDLDATRLNRALAMLDELEPKTGAEAMLAAQMVAIHEAAMNCMARATLPGQTFEGRELNLKFSTKLTRAYAQHMATLEKSRRGGQQKVTVEHVHVHDGGQAIVGAVSGRADGS